MQAINCPTALVDQDTATVQTREYGTARNVTSAAKQDKGRR